MSRTEMSIPDSIARVWAREADLREASSKTRVQYERGLLTFEEFMNELASVRNEYCDMPGSKIMTVVMVEDESYTGHEDCDHAKSIYHCDAC